MATFAELSCLNKIILQKLEKTQKENNKLKKENNKLKIKNKKIKIFLKKIKQNYNIYKK